MKKKVIREMTVCDECGEPCYDNCCDCGADYCYDHWKELGVTYQYGVYCSGWANGYYCLACDARLRASGEDPLHSAYLTVKALINENDAFYADFKERAAKAGLRVEVLWEARKWLNSTRRKEEEK